MAKTWKIKITQISYQVTEKKKVASKANIGERERQIGSVVEGKSNNPKIPKDLMKAILKMID